jgi:hypothetical protein
MAHQDEGGRSKNESREHDRETRSYEETTGNPYHFSKAMRLIGAVLAEIVVIALKRAISRGFVHW